MGWRRGEGSKIIFFLLVEKTDKRFDEDCAGGGS